MGCFFNRISARCFLFKKEEEVAFVFDSEEEPKEDDDTSRKSWIRYDRRRPNFLFIAGDIVSLSNDGDPGGDIGTVGVEDLDSPESEESVLLSKSNRTDLLLRERFRER